MCTSFLLTRFVNDEAPKPILLCNPNSYQNRINSCFFATCLVNTCVTSIVGNGIVHRARHSTHFVRATIEVHLFFSGVFHFKRLRHDTHVLP